MRTRVANRKIALVTEAARGSAIKKDRVSSKTLAQHLVKPTGIPLALHSRCLPAALAQILITALFMEFPRT